MQRRIKILKIERLEGDFFAWVRVSDFYLLPPLARKAKVRLRIVKRYGLPFVWLRWRRRKILLGGLALFFVALYILSSKLWFVEILTPNESLKTAVEESARACGVVRGAKKSDLDTEQIARRILQENPTVAWAGVEISGTKLVIQVVEKTSAPYYETEAASLVAAKSGEILKAVPLEGVCLVQAGEYVKKGDTLIESVSRNGEPVRAQGVVLARVVYEESASAPLVRLCRTRTGRRSFGGELLFFGQALFHYDAGDKYLRAEREEYRKKFSVWRNQEPFVELVIDIDYELALERETVEPKLAREQALKDARESLSQKVPPSAYIASQSVAKEVQTDEAYEITLRVVTEENIAEWVN